VEAPSATENLVAVDPESIREAPKAIDNTGISPPAKAPATPPGATNQEQSQQSSAPKGSSEVYGNRHPGGGKTRNANQYFGQLMTWMNKHKHYPAELKKKKQEGVVEIQFTLGRDGELLEVAIARSCGNPALDQAALQMMTNAAPFPPIPGFINQESLTLVIPVEYSLITNDIN